MKIVLINPPQPYLVDPGMQAPLSLLYLYSVLESNNYDVELLDLASVQQKDIVIPQADFYGITATSLDYEMACWLCVHIKKQYPNSSVALGGAHATCVPPKGEAVAPFDSVCIGEGEKTILDMVQDSWAGVLKPTYKGDPVKNLDTLPLPARHALGRQGGRIFGLDPEFAQGVSTVIQGSRGCPFACAFCAQKAIWDCNKPIPRMRYRSFGSIIAEIIHVKDRYGINEFRFSDEILNVSRKRLSKLCESLEPLDITWRGSVRAGISSEEDFRQMRRAGCREISPGIESGDQRVLDALHKKTTVEENIELVQRASAAGLNVRVLLMTGTPGEHPDTPERTRDMLARMQGAYHSIALKQFRPLPGCAIWSHPEQYEATILSRDYSDMNFFFWRNGNQGPTMAKPKSLIALKNMTPQQLEANMARMQQYVDETGRETRG